MTLAGATVAVEGGPVRIALAGADMRMTIDGADAARQRSHTLAPGAVLEIGGTRDGARAYLAASGGFAVAPVFGSVSTHQRSGIGGFCGRALRAGDLLPLAAPAPAGPEQRLAADAPPGHERLRIVLGPQDDYFTPAAIDALLGGDFTIGTQSDRMGYRLGGTASGARQGLQRRSPMGSRQAASRCQATGSPSSCSPTARRPADIPRSRR